MPVLPTADQLQAPAFKPTTGVVSVDNTQVSQALADAGRTAQRTSERVLNYIDTTASLHAREAAVALKRAQNELAIGEGGYAHLRNGAATTPGVVKDYQTRFEDQVRAIGGGLSAEARAKFDSLAREQGNHFQAGVLTHIMQQDLNHRGAVYQAQVAASSETMGLHYNDPALILRERANLEAIVAGYAQKNGIKDKALLERMLQDARGAGHQAVIDGYVTAGQAGQAKEYFDEVRKNGGEMTPEKAKSIENMLKPQVAFEQGRAIAAELFSLHVGGASASEVAAEKLRLTDGTSAQVVAAVDKAFTDQVRAQEQDRADLGGDILLSAYKGEGGSGIDDHRLRGIFATDPTFGFHLLGQLEAIAKRKAAGAAAGSAGEKMSNVALYGEIAAAIRDSDTPLTEKDIINRAGGILNDQEIKNLFTMVNQQNQAGAKFKIDSTLIDASMPPSARGDAGKTAAYKGFIERKTQEWKSNNPGKIPTMQEQRDIMNSARVEHIDTSKGFFGFLPGVEQGKPVAAFEATEGKSFPPGFGGAGISNTARATRFAQLKEQLPGLSDEALIAIDPRVIELRKRLPNTSTTDLISLAAYMHHMRSIAKPGDEAIPDALLVKKWEEKQTR